LRRGRSTFADMTAPADNPGGGGSEKPPPPRDAESIWRENFDAFEKAIGRPLEEFMKSDEFADAAAKYLKAHGEMQEQLTQGSDAWLRTWNVDSATEVAALRAELRALADRLEALERRVAAAGS
jgi:hypothetical protein